MTFWILVVAVISYMVSVFPVALVSDYFFGKRTARMVLWTYGFPIVGGYRAVVLTARVIVWPWRYRNRRLFKETFGDDPHGTYSQVSVDQTLRKLAQEMDRLFKEEEESRNKPPRLLWMGPAWIRAPINSEEQEEALSSAKQRFWEAHSLATKLGFETRLTYKEYLPIIVESRS
jgi:hypothetical protein